MYRKRDVYRYTLRVLRSANDNVHVFPNQWCGVINYALVFVTAPVVIQYAMMDVRLSYYC